MCFPLCFPFLWHFFHRNHDSCSAGTFSEPPQESCLYGAYVGCYVGNEFGREKNKSTLRYVDYYPLLLLLLPLPLSVAPALFVAATASVAAAAAVVTAASAAASVVATAAMTPLLLL